VNKEPNILYMTRAEMHKIEATFGVFWRYSTPLDDRMCSLDIVDDVLGLVEWELAELRMKAGRLVHKRLEIVEGANGFFAYLLSPLPDEEADGLSCYIGLDPLEGFGCPYRLGSLLWWLELGRYLPDQYEQLLEAYFPNADNDELVSYDTVEDAEEAARAGQIVTMGLKEGLAILGIKLDLTKIAENSLYLRLAPVQATRDWWIALLGFLDREAEEVLWESDYVYSEHEEADDD
jgi:hypothetical protein